MPLSERWFKRLLRMPLVGSVIRRRARRWRHTDGFCARCEATYGGDRMPQKAAPERPRSNVFLAWFD